MSKSKSIITAKSLDIIFIISSIIFNISVSILYIATKFGNMTLLKFSSVIALLMAIPFAITLVGYMMEKAEKKITISLVFILFYFFIELFLDYILKIPFRDIIALHIPYIVIFYAAEFSMIGITFDKNKKMGFVVLSTFGILIGCLIYMYMG